MTEDDKAEIPASNFRRCSRCGRSFKSRQAADDHIRDAHKGDGERVPVRRAEDDDSMGNFWRDWNEAKKERKAARMATVPERLARLDDLGLTWRQFTTDHYRVAERFDWWPSTGYWKSLDGKRKGWRFESLVFAARASCRGG